MPTDLDIDYKKPLRGTMPHYTRHVVIHTAQNDWESRIEDGAIGRGREKSVNLARELKELIGPKGKYHNPHQCILVTNSSLTSRGRTRGRDVSVYPEGYEFTNVGETNESLEAFVEQVLMSSKLSLADMERFGAYQAHRCRVMPVVLICGHNNRDRRCGVLGPLLLDEFFVQGDKHATIDPNPSEPNPSMAQFLQKRRSLNTQNRSDITSNTSSELNMGFRVGLISHIGGHAWAGNVIVYLPPDYRLSDGRIPPLAGKGVWYGRVEPKHVEVIIEETIRKGRVIEELLRGVHGGADGS